MIYDFAIALTLILNLGEGDFKERKVAEHNLIQMEIPYLYLKTAYHNIDDPEVRVRLKRVAWNQWCLETQEKYKPSPYVYNTEELQEQDFRRDFHDQY